jgi:hypothetical protein
LGADYLSYFTCDDNGIITNIANPPYNLYAAAIPSVFYTDDDGTTNLGREIIQLIVLMAGYRITIAVLANVYTSVTAKAGSVESINQKSSTVLVNVLKAIKNKIDMALSRLSDLGMTTVVVYDAVSSMTDNIVEGNTFFTGGDFGPGPMGAGYREF